MRLTARGRLALVAIAFALPAAGAVAAATAAQVIQDRQANYKDLGKNMKALMDQLHSGSPDLSVIRPAADKIKGYAHQIPSWFPAGSGPEAGVKTAAKPEIWTDPHGFATDAQNLAAAADKLDDAAQGTDIVAITAAAGATGHACGACHDAYRVKQP